MKILLTGSSGFLGKYFLLHLGKDTITLNRTNSTIICDLSVEVPKFNTSFDVVIHNAGKAHFIPRSYEDEKIIYQTNVIGTQNLLIGLSNILPKHFVYISSVSVYGLNEGCNINEDTPLLAIDSYGKSKIEAENIVLNWCHENNVICTIFRLPLVVGNNPPGNLGSMIKGIKKGYYFNIAGGNARKSMVLANDIASFVLKAAKVGGTYNLTDGYHPSFKELSYNLTNQLNRSYVPNMPYFIAKVLAQLGTIFGKYSPLNLVKLQKITSTLTFDDTKARESFGWKPTQVLKDFKLF